MGNFLKKNATPLCVAVFLLIGFSGCLLFFGVHNHDLVELHEKFGIAFVVLAILHLVRNWKSFTILLRRRVNPWIIGGIAALGLILIGSTLFASGPGRGSPIRGSVMAAELMAHQPLAQTAAALGMDKDEMMGRLVKSGVKISAGDTSLADISASSGWQVGQLYLLLMPESAGRGHRRHRHQGH